MKKTILIVDDMAINLDVLTAILGDDYKLMAATGGKSAIKLLERKSPDLVLLDIFMPDVDGFEVLRFINSHPVLSGIPVIFASGEYDPDTKAKCIELGAADYIKKPYDADVISAKVRAIFESKDPA